MSFTNKLEASYLNILRHLLLVVATISLIAVLIASGMALRASLSSPPQEPKQVKIEDKANDLKKAFNVENFKKDTTKTDEKSIGPMGKSEPEAFQIFLDNSIKSIASNLISYELAINKKDLQENRQGIEEVLRKMPLKEGVLKKTSESILTFYYETLILLTGELKRQAPEIAKLPEDKKIQIGPVLLWHARQVNQAVTTIDEANAQQKDMFERQQIAYFEKKASILKYATIAGSALGIFLVIIMLFIIVKIERDLRPLQEIADRVSRVSDISCK